MLSTVSAYYKRDQIRINQPPTFSNPEMETKLERSIRLHDYTGSQKHGQDPNLSQSLSQDTTDCIFLLQLFVYIFSIHKTN